MVRPRRFPVMWVSLALLGIVVLGGLRLTNRSVTPEPAQEVEAAAPNSPSPGPLPALPAAAIAAAIGEEIPRASAPGEAWIDPPEPPDMRVRTLRQGPTPECVAATGWVNMGMTIRGRHPLALFQKLEVTIWRVEGRELREVEDATNLPTEIGEFGIGNLPDGEYVIEFASEHRGQMVRARRGFRVAGYTTDLGNIDLIVYAGVRAKVVDIAGRSIEQADVVVVRPEEDPEQARRLATNENGWVTYFDLEPDLLHQVVVLGLPTRLERPVRTPGRSKQTVDVVFETTLRTVPTTISFFVDGEFTRLEALPGLQSDTRLKSFPKRGGIVSTWMLPGTYRFWTADREGTLVVDNCDCVRAKVNLFPKAPPEED